MVLEDTKIVVLNIFNTITHMVIGGVSLVAIVFALRPGFSDDFRQHIIMCTVGVSTQNLYLDFNKMVALFGKSML